MSGSSGDEPKKELLDRYRCKVDVWDSSLHMYCIFQSIGDSPELIWGHLGPITASGWLTQSMSGFSGCYLRQGSRPLEFGAL